MPTPSETYCSCRRNGTPLRSKLIRFRNHSFSDIHDTFFKNGNGSSSQTLADKLLPLRFRSESSDAKHSIAKMMAVYPQDVLRKFLSNKLLSPEELFYFKQKLASDLAYNAFTQSCFNTGELIRNRLQ